jgi:hypothetical protein
MSVLVTADRRDWFHRGHNRLIANRRREMDTQQKLEMLKKVYGNEETLDLVVDKLLEAVLNQHRLNLKRYAQDLQEFEVRYHMDSAAFYGRFEAGDLGDAMDFFEWAGLYEIYQTLQEKVRDLEAAL